MTRRIAIGIHEIGRVMAGEQSIFLRPLRSSFERVQEGELLWIAEPFYLERAFDGLAPSAARDRGAKPAYAADNVFDAGALARTHGQRQPARSLCREWHRAHMVITSRSDLRLQDLQDEDIAQLGFSTRGAFAAHWDKEAALVGVVAFKFQANPRILRFAFDLVREPIVFAPKPEPRKRGRPARKPERLTQKSTPPPAAPAVAPQPVIVAPQPPPVAPRPPIAPEPRPIAVSPRLAPSPPELVTQQAPLGEIFTTAKGDKGFLAALRRERPRMHADFLEVPARSRTPAYVIAQPLPTNGACPTCGSRLAFGCAHHPLQEDAA